MAIGIPAALQNLTELTAAFQNEAAGLIEML
jgi:hypothetical protein